MSNAASSGAQLARHIVSVVRGLSGLGSLLSFLPSSISRSRAVPALAWNGQSAVAPLTMFPATCALGWGPSNVAMIVRIRLVSSARIFAQRWSKAAPLRDWIPLMLEEQRLVARFGRNWMRVILRYLTSGACRCVTGRPKKRTTLSLDFFHEMGNET